MPPQFCRLILTFLTLFFGVSIVRAQVGNLVPRDGQVTSSWFIYQSIRYEPLCGTIISPLPLYTHSCNIPIGVFSNNTVDKLAYYDQSGVRLKNAIVGAGVELCMCFSLGAVGADSADMCIHFDANAQSMWDYVSPLPGRAIGASRPGAAKSLPQCADVNLNALKASWSATALLPDSTESVITLGHITKTTTLIPSVVDLTTNIPTTITLSDGQLTTSTVTRTSQVPVVTVTANAGPLSRSDKIALGVGLGFGIPTLVLMTIGLCRRSSGKHSID